MLMYMDKFVSIYVFQTRSIFTVKPCIQNLVVCVIDEHELQALTGPRKTDGA